ncbi:MAG TPA: GNAT family N-acetyltransferase [Candidatus Angelobacter sp.]|nr:GNAT family N-acetyltransferase [Candidatus Angelobacter sp.]
MSTPRLICQTDRLLLREFTMDDLEPLTAMHLDPEVYRFIGLRTPEQTRNVLRDWIAAYQSPGFAKWAVVLRETGEFIGRCGMMIEEYEGISEPELGWTFARAHWGHGYATEAAVAALKHGFDNLQLRRIISLIHPDNLASERVALRIGMGFERLVQWKDKPANLYAKSANDVNEGN